jgi:hypothetical protein
MLTAQNVKDALKVLKNGRAWYKGWYAVGKDGRTHAPIDSDEAVKFCAIGAGRRIVPNEGLWLKLFEDILRQDGIQTPNRFWNVSITSFNDQETTTFADIKALFKKAIAKLEAQEQNA